MPRAHGCAPLQNKHHTGARRMDRARWIAPGRTCPYTLFIAILQLLRRCVLLFNLFSSRFRQIAHDSLRCGCYHFVHIAKIELCLRHAMKIITLINEKGGVGKTTLAIHIAAGLALRGYRVILADADAQGHATVSLGLKKAPGLYDLLVRGATFREVLIPADPARYTPEGSTCKGQLYVVPSNVETRSIPIQISDALAVSDRFRELEGMVDAVVFDTSPTPSLLHGSIYLATDAIIYPTKCEFLSFDGLIESFSHREMMQSTRAYLGLKTIEVMGIVPMMYRATTLVHQENLNKLKQRYGNKVWPEVLMRTSWAEASTVGMLVYRFAPESSAARDAWSLVNRVEMEVKGE